MTLPETTLPEIVAAALQGLVAGIFALAAFSKLRGREEFGRFVTTVRKLTMLSGRAPTLLAGAFAVVEAVTAALIAVPATARAGLWAAAALLVLFVGVVFRAVRGGVFAECGCFGNRSAIMSYPVLLRNLLLLGFALAGLVEIAFSQSIRPTE
ncbi:MauE/DoxX family redox-associated membrane protein, partial [Spirillospora sp. NPDC049652]